MLGRPRVALAPLPPAFRTSQDVREHHRWADARQQRREFCLTLAAGAAVWLSFLAPDDGDIAVEAWSGDDESEEETEA